MGIGGVSQQRLPMHKGLGRCWQKKSAGGDYEDKKVKNRRIAVLEWRIKRTESSRSVIRTARSSDLGRGTSKRWQGWSVE